MQVTTTQAPIPARQALAHIVATHRLTAADLLDMGAVTDPRRARRLIEGEATPKEHEMLGISFGIVQKLRSKK